MRIAVTGGAGAVGSAIIEQALARADRIVSIDRADPPEPHAGIDYWQADVADYASLLTALAGCDAVIHLAAIPRPFEEPDHTLEGTSLTVYVKKD